MFYCPINRPIVRSHSLIVILVNLPLRQVNPTQGEGVVVLVVVCRLHVVPNQPDGHAQKGLGSVGVPGHTGSSDNLPPPKKY